MPVRERVVSTNGIAMHLVEAGAGLPLVFIHGLGWSHRLWLPALDRYAVRYRAIAGDSRGHGQSDKPEGPYSLAQMTEDWNGALDALGVTACCIVGLSLGGMIAQRLAIDAPDKVRALVLVSTTCHASAEVGGRIAERLEAMRARGAKAGAEMAAETIFADGFRAANPDYIERFIAERTRQPQEPLIAAMAATAGFDLRPGLRKLDIPTRVIAGAADKLTPPERVREVASHIPGAELVEMAGAGHIIPAEQPEPFYTLLDDFLGRRYVQQ